MNLPIQAAPIDRANRLATAKAISSDRVALAQLDPRLPRTIACAACFLLPPPAALLCRAFCRLTAN